MPSALAVLILNAISNLVERFAGHLEDEIYSHRNHDLRWRQPLTETVADRWVFGDSQTLSGIEA
jgi:hypothetical protein